MIIKKVALYTIVSLSGLVFLTACQAISINSPVNFSGTPIAPGAMAPAPLPDYRMGDKYYYSNGSYDKITKLGPNIVEWENNAKRRSVTTTDPMAPELYLETRTREYAKTSDPSVGDIWPLAVGKTSSFATNVRYRTKETGTEGDFRQLWGCTVESAEKVRVLAGIFDTYRVSCQRKSRSLRTGKTYYRQTVVYHYAPEIGNYVRYQSTTKGKSIYVRELIAIRPDIGFLDDQTARNIRHTFQDALENKQNDQTVSWKSKNGKITTSTTPTQTFQSADGKFCRNYKQFANQGDGERLYVGVACREDKLKWLTPRR
ncbi:MAG: hypothetical protein OEY84_08700 [Rhodospirillaceae bacterium]|nr:hypothetical protein [Rhodospirillaceae bacterium]